MQQNFEETAPKKARLGKKSGFLLVENVAPLKTFSAKCWIVLAEKKKLYFYADATEQSQLRHSVVLAECREISFQEQFDQKQLQLGFVKETNETIRFTALSESEFSYWKDVFLSISSFYKTSLPLRFLTNANKKIIHTILVRHGHYINAYSKNVPDCEQVLSEIGRQQAEITGQYLEQFCCQTRAHNAIRIPCSDMTRATETANIIGREMGVLDVSVSSLLREGWPGRPYPSIYYPSSNKNDVNNSSGNTPMGNIVKLPDDAQRFENSRLDAAYSHFFSNRLINDDDDLVNGEIYRVIVCHANLIRFFVCRSLGIEPVGTWGKFEINHCGLTRVDIHENGAIKMLAINETAHLPRTLVTSSEDHL